MQICIILLFTAVVLKRQKITSFFYCFRMETLQSRRHCHESVKHLIIRKGLFEKLTCIFVKIFIDLTCGSKKV